MEINKTLKLPIIIFIIGLLILGVGIHRYCERIPVTGTIINLPQESIGRTGGKRQRIYIERYAVIKFDNLTTKAVILEPTSYYTAKVGDRVKMNLRRNIFDENFLNSGALQIIGMFLVLVASFWLIKATAEL